MSRLPKKVGILLFSVVIFLKCSDEVMVRVPDISIVPRPQFIEQSEDVFFIKKRTKIIIVPKSDNLVQVSNHLAEKLRTVTGYRLPVLQKSKPTRKRNAIYLIIDTSLSDLGDEGYIFESTEKSVTISAIGKAGIFYGIQTLYQLLPPLIGSLDSHIDSLWYVPCVTIKDKPRFSWRGMHLDVGRHFFPVSFIKKYIDLLAMYKLNTFHWHLTEDQGWRIEIKQYPRLTEFGSKRNETNGDGQLYSGFYTQDEIREVVAYAEERFVRVVPEIEMPGHSRAAVASYPELSCTGGPFKVGSNWGIYKDVYCAGNEKTFEFLQNILLEVFELFPGEFVHIGGDECPKNRWKQCPKCQKRIREEGLKNEKELQSYFTKRMAQFIHAHGKRLIGWDEILEGGLAPDAAVMSWRGMDGGIEAARLGHDVVMSPTSHCYFDYYQSENKEEEPKAFNRFLPLETVYAFEPVPEILSEDKSKHILGAQANMWTEYMDSEKHVEYMLFPRMCALSEVVWSGKENRDFEDFNKRMEDHYIRFKIKNVNFRSPKNPQAINSR